MAKRTINLDKLETSDDALLLEALSVIAREVRRRQNKAIDDALDTNYESRVKTCRKRIGILTDVLSQMSSWPGDYDKV